MNYHLQYSHCCHKKNPSVFSLLRDYAENARYQKLAAGFTLDGAGSLEIDWHAPYGLLMRRPEFQKAIELESVGPLRKKKDLAAPNPRHYETAAAQGAALYEQGRPK